MGFGRWGRQWRRVWVVEFHNYLFLNGKNQNSEDYNSVTLATEFMCIVPPQETRLKCPKFKSVHRFALLTMTPRLSCPYS